MLRLIIIGLTLGDGMVLLLGETCVCLGGGGGVRGKCKGQ